MTSEVLILNKRAVVLAADSAITSSGGEHPRYSKSASKIFDLTDSGGVAAAFFGNAHLDLVPLELAIKLFRRNLGATTFEGLEGYRKALTDFLSANDLLFPPNLRVAWVEQQFDNAVLEVTKHAEYEDPLAFDLSKDLLERQQRWAALNLKISQLFEGMTIPPSLSQAERDALINNITPWAGRVQEQILQAPKLAAVNSVDLATLAHKLRYAMPHFLLPKTGLVVAGYGTADIFPGYKQIAIYGHVGEELCFTSEDEFRISHGNPAMIQPLAQTSMIDTFTDGFSSSVASIVDSTGRESLIELVGLLRSAGVQISDEQKEAAVNAAHSAFKTQWKRKNWNQNYTPLMQVLATLEVQEMAHLAESLLGLESLKERVTSPTEEVGGPIDVAAITKAEGLVWIKRKHYFPSDLNLRYAARVQRTISA